MKKMTTELYHFIENQIFWLNCGFSLCALICAVLLIDLCVRVSKK